MTANRRLMLAWMLLTLGAAANACECVDRPALEAAEGSGSTSLDTSATDGVSAMGGETSTAGKTEEPVNVSRFIGMFHNESWLVPLGKEVNNPGGASIMNLEIRADGTASMTMETCSELTGTREFEWLWEAEPGPWLVFSPGPGEESLRFKAADDLESLRVTLDGDCALRFEVDGYFSPWNETFRPGRACWVNRCEPSWTVEIDYCEGEDPTPCE